MSIRIESSHSKDIIYQLTPRIPSSGNEILAEPYPVGPAYAREAGTEYVPWSLP